MNAANILLDAYDAAEILLLSTRRVRALARDGQLPHIVLPGGEIRFDPVDLSQFVERHKRPATDGGAE
jgi:hypothetical protein